MFGVDFDGRTYMDAGVADFELGDKLGEARALPCDDTGDRGADPPDRAASEAYDVYEVEGLKPRVAIAVGDFREDASLVAVRGEDKGFPPEVEKLIH